MKSLLVLSLLAIVDCSSSSGPAPTPPPVMTKVVVSNTSGMSQTLRVLAVPRASRLYSYPIPFSYRSDQVLRPGDSVAVRYAHDTTQTSTDSIEYLVFQAPPRLDEVIVQVMREPEDTVLSIGIGPSLMTVKQPTCTDLHFGGLNNIVCKDVTVKLINLARDTVTALIAPRVLLAGNSCFAGWAITDTTTDSIEVGNYASPLDAMFEGQGYGRFFVNGQQGPALTEQLDSVSAYPYWTINHTGTCP